jgi:hypothetical protein
MPVCHFPATDDRDVNHSDLRQPAVSGNERDYTGKMPNADCQMPN